MKEVAKEIEVVTKVTIFLDNGGKQVLRFETAGYICDSQVYEMLGELECEYIQVVYLDNYFPEMRLRNGAWCVAISRYKGAKVREHESGVYSTTLED